MKPYRLTPAAEDDLFEIWSHIAPENPAAADALESEILESCQRLAQRPDLGHWRRELTDKPVRFFTVHQNYAVIYEPAAQPLQILRILHWARDVAAELE